MLFRSGMKDRDARVCYAKIKTGTVVIARAKTVVDQPMRTRGIKHIAKRGKRGGGKAFTLDQGHAMTRPALGKSAGQKILSKIFAAKTARLSIFTKMKSYSAGR